MPSQSGVIGSVTRLLLVLASPLLAVAAAQGFTGTFTGEAGNGRVEVELLQQGDDLAGVLLGPGVRFELEGFVDDGIGVGLAHTAEGSVGFEAHLEGDVLGLYLFELDDRGDPVMDSVIELIMTRQPGAAAQPPPADGPPSPFGAAPDPFGDPAPAASANPLVGTFADERLTLTVDETAPGSYAGSVVAGGQTYTLDVFETREGLVGSFESGGQAFTFTAHLEGDVLVFSTAGTTYRLTRVAGEAPVDPFALPPGGPSGGAPGGTATGTAQPPRATDPVLANGRFAVLTQDNALAFIEALEFVLAQLGYPYRFSESERVEAVRAIADAFPQGEQFDQLVLADARTIWERVQANWHAAGAAEQREFALGVLILAFGEETVRQWVGPVGAGGGRPLGSGTCTSFEDCTSGFVDQQTWTDTFNAQGCWAAAGCDGYDPGAGTFTYSDDY